MNIDDLLNGIDVSHYQGDINWTGVKADGIAFAFCKATQGKTYRDERFGDNWGGMASVGLIRGAYHFYETDQDPTLQANNFINTIGSLKHTDFVICDIEVFYGDYGGFDVCTNLKTYLDRVQKATGKRPIIYTNPSFWNDHGDETFSDYPLWIANYGVDYPTIPAGWEYYLFWQYTQSGSCSGVDGDVDRNYCSVKALFLEYAKKPQPKPQKRKKVIRIYSKIVIDE